MQVAEQTDTHERVFQDRAHLVGPDLAVNLSNIST